ncbi:hypothetical protein CONPUDRAFT_146999 [Coniophora puteana RWD-64-598 SS2]|uniref:UBR-type domain-containing protein n=1 Tax=Coniophora puteana (strain RWD-64-598) TaxID=741705 RepID=A0A5M3M9K5_CONPW|nr:uncharacterized protein CONPUDRAFT_146999 [Coniophora puteana RWD-64-598 SS2]EIW75928.1 hypothetical protein CONPUDRAFT_146999 [Coniophora puteana RWD-64-598 SS2]
MSTPPPTGHASSSSPSRPLTDLLEAQSALLAEAAEAIPHTFASCTYALGPRRQAVHLCLTCDVPRGLCDACAVACHHADHNQLELFPKRNFRCDCPTTAVPGACSLHRGEGAGIGPRSGEREKENEENIYGQNFWGVFCRCSRPYDARTERETMVECVTCEDWFHESCLNLRERPAPRDLDSADDSTKAKTTAEASNPSDGDEAKGPEDEDLEGKPANSKTTVETASPSDGDQAEDAEDDDDDAASVSSLPPALLTAEDFDAFVCASCVASIPALKRIAGTRGAPIVIRDEPSGAWHTLDDVSPTRTPRGQDREEADTVDVEAVDAETAGSVPASAGTKRERSVEPAGTSEAASPDAKRARLYPPDLDGIPSHVGTKRERSVEPAETSEAALPDAKRARLSLPNPDGIPAHAGVKREHSGEPTGTSEVASPPDAKRAQLSSPGHDGMPAHAGAKREHSGEPTGTSEAASPPDAKRARLSSPDHDGPDREPDGPDVKVCLAPSPNMLAQEILDRVPPLAEVKSAEAKDERRQPQQPPPPRGSTHPLSAGDVFLTEGWRERWCRCPECLSSLSAHPYLLAEEETYEPPEDPDSALSLEELGMRALQTLPREKTLDGIRAFNDMRDDLMSYLRPFAREGNAVSEADVRAFFEARREKDASRAAMG